MSNTAVATDGFTPEAFERFLGQRDEPGWLSDRRREAWGHFERQGLPSRSEEEWMRTDIRLFKLGRYGFPGEVRDIGSAPAVLSEGVELAGELHHANGLLTMQQHDDSLRGKGVIYLPLAQAAREHSDLVKEHLLTKAVDPHFDKFSSLHSACWSSGTLLYVPRNTHVDRPFLATSTIAQEGSDLGHTLVILDEGAEATLLMEWGSPTPTDTGLYCGATEVILKPGARLRLVSLQDLGQGVWFFGHQKAVLGRDASLQWTVGALGSRLAKVNQHVSLEGEGAECQVNGVLFTENRQHLSYHTRQHHVAPHCRSDFLYKAALQDQSRTVWRGMIQVGKQAQKTDGYQRNDNLLLSNDSRADAIPGLQIEADDVRCTHGSTTGRVDEELIFYAQCRGFTRKEAIRMIVTGFFQQIFDRIPIASVREALGHAIARRVREYE